MKQYTKTITVQAVQWTGENLEEVKAFCALIEDLTVTFGNSSNLYLDDDDSWCIVTVGKWILSRNDEDWNVLTNADFLRDYRKVVE